ncbi:ribonuclease HII [Mycoplasmopsis agalactiae]|uniref:ribonuclease HII n=1 Tax=Mycoplasmopsis agalactiae TaxID=2110 RepID=UPI001F2434C8|nr:ribonuclease HII [Mycoplasmopsis agalactiae]MCE6115523.1 ribonuclease HII [Mycoplasmopsis agalactiae]
MLDYELKNFTDYNLIAGVDEAGRGCCAGPLVVASVIMPNDYINENIKDSKKLSAKQRDILFDEILNVCIDYHIVTFPSSYVDKYNPKKSSKNGMKICIDSLNTKPDLVITDFEKIDELAIKQVNLVKGDSISLNVACASILAKVTRDRYMIKIANKYKEYEFEKHKGYCTKRHTESIIKYGASPEHRLTYKNVRKAISIYEQRKFDK